MAGVFSRKLHLLTSTLTRGSRDVVRSVAPASWQQRRSAHNEPNVTNLFNEEHENIRKSLRQLIDTEINPYVDQWEKEARYPAHDVHKKLGAAGFLGVNKPTEFGGMGLDYSYNAVVLEELGHINCGGIPMSLGVTIDMATPALVSHGTDELKRQFLAPVIAGDMVPCIGVSEPSAGSDVAGIRTRAEKRGDDYVINGSKMWITNASQADWMCVLANTGDGPIHQNKSLIIMPMNLPGVKVARLIDKMGMHSSDTTEIYLEDVRVPQSYLIGEEGQGFTYQMEQFQLERMVAALGSLVPLQKAINQTLEYTSQRMAFGKPILANQSVHFRLAELQTEVELLKALIYKGVAKIIQGEDITYLASMAKLKAGRLCREVPDACLQYWGGMGYTADVYISRLYRDMRLVSIGGGADEVMLSIIAKYMGTLPEVKRKK